MSFLSGPGEKLTRYINGSLIIAKEGNDNCQRHYVSRENLAQTIT